LGIGKPYDPIARKGVVGRDDSFLSNGSATLFFTHRFSLDDRAGPPRQFGRLPPILAIHYQAPF
jgi:hypothetical protein